MSKPWFEVQTIIVEKATLPERVRIKVIEFDPETRYILLRPCPPSAHSELNVAAGFSPPCAG